MFKNVRYINIWIFYFFIDLEYWGKSKIFLIGKILGILDKKSMFIWEVGGREGRSNKMGIERVF